MDEIKITELTESYRQILVFELQRKESVLLRENRLERRKSEILQTAYAGKEITGTNAETRKVQEQAVINADDQLRTIQDSLDESIHLLQLAEIDRKVIESQISLYRAMLYSKAGKIDLEIKPSL